MSGYYVTKRGAKVQHNWTCRCGKSAYVNPSHLHPDYRCKSCLRTERSATLTCAHCEKKFQRYRCEVRKSHGSKVFCSRTCYTANRAKVDRVCLLCGKKFKAYQSEIRKGHGKFCSRSCNAREKLRRALPERRSRAYRVWRSKVFKRDKYTCTACGQHGGYLEAHHLKPWARYPHLRLEVSNGSTMCLKCHYKLHNRRARKKVASVKA